VASDTETPSGGGSGAGIAAGLAAIVVAAGSALWWLLSPAKATCGKTGKQFRLTDDKVKELQKLHDLDEWRPEYDNIQQLSPEGWEQIATRLCDHCGESLLVTENHLATLRANLWQHGVEDASTVGWRYLCRLCSERLARVVCSECDQPLCTKDDREQDYASSKDLRNFRELSNIAPNQPRHLCPSCFLHCEQMDHAARERLRGFIGVVSGSDMPGWRIARDLGKVVYEARDCTSTDTVNVLLARRAAYIGGNAILKVRHEVHREREEYEFPKGNPYMKSRWKEWLSASGFAASLQPAEAPEDVAGVFSLAIVADTNVWLDIPQLASCLPHSVEIVVPAQVFEEVDRRKQDPELGERAREIIRSWERTGLSVSHKRAPSRALDHGGSLRPDCLIVECVHWHARNASVPLAFVSRDAGARMLAVGLRDSEALPNLKVCDIEGLADILSTVDAESETRLRTALRGARFRGGISRQRGIPDLKDTSSPGPPDRGAVVSDDPQWTHKGYCSVCGEWQYWSGPATVHCTGGSLKSISQRETVGDTGTLKPAARVCDATAELEATITKVRRHQFEDGKCVACGVPDSGPDAWASVCESGM
jgi:hypothetical protein